MELYPDADGSTLLLGFDNGEQIPFDDVHVEEIGLRNRINDVTDYVQNEVYPNLTDPAQRETAEREIPGEGYDELKRAVDEYRAAYGLD